MQIDKNSLDKMLSLDDDQLSAAITKIAADAGIDLKSIGVSKTELAKIRSALSSATDKDIALAAEKLSKYYKK